MLLSFFQFLLFLLRATLAAVLIAAGAAKLADTRSFAMTLIGLGIPVRHRRLVRSLALAIPFIEVGVGLTMVSGIFPTVANGCALVLLGSFSLVVLVALYKRIPVACRCFG